MTTLKNSFVCLTLIATLAGTASAQLVSTKGGSRVQNYGPSAAYLQLYAGGEIRREDMRYRATPTSSPSGPARMRYDANGFALVHTFVFGHKYTAFSARADAHLVEGRGNNSSSWYVAGTPYSSSVSGHVRLRMAGYTFWEYTRNASGYLGSATYSHNVIDVAKTFYVSGIPIRVGVTGGATLGLSAGTNIVLDPTSSLYMGSRSRIELNANGTGYCSGAASAGVGWSGFGAGVEFELRFLNSTLTMGVQGATTGISGLVRFAIQPLRIYLKAYAEAWRRWTITIASWSIGNSFTWSKVFS